MEEQHAHVSVFGDRPGEDAAVHIGVPARFEHERSPHRVVVVPGVPPHLEDRGTLELGVVPGDDPQGLTGGVRVDDAEAGPPGGRIPFDGSGAACGL